MKFRFTAGKIRILVFLLLAGGAAAFYFGYYQPMKKRAAAEAAQKLALDGGDMDRTYKIRRDDLSIGLLQGGYVNASQKHKLSLQASYKTRLLWVIDENTKVKEGDLLAKFETDSLQEQIEGFEIELDNLKKELDLAFESEKILLSTNAADLQNANENLLQAEDALRKYRRFERVDKRDSLELAITNAESTLATANTGYTTTRDSVIETKEGEDPDEKRRQLLQKAQVEVDKATNSLESAENNRKVFRRYDHPSKMTRLSNALEQAKLTLQKTRISCDSKVVQQKKTIDNLRRRIRRTADQLARHQEYMTMMELKSPVEGVVIYGDPDRRWGNIDIKPGIDVNKGQVLLTIPEMSNLVVDFDLPEQYRSKAKLRDRAVIYPDSLPGQRFTGAISHIDTLPVNLVSWDSASPKIYKSKVKLDKQSERLVNGMSVQINVVTKVIPKTLFVPVEAVFEENDRFFVYRGSLTGIKEVDVKIGESNDNFVQILEGLDEGDVVYLYRPYQKKD